MQLLVIRHAIAMDREEFSESGQPDEERPLTSRGVKRMKRVVRGLRSEVPSIDVLATSPLTRAVQTADLVASAYDIDAEETDSLVPGSSFEPLRDWLRAQQDKDVVAVVGHEPHLSSLATWLLAGSGDSRIELRKGGMCLLEFEDSVDAGGATLLWLMAPRQLRALA